MEKKKRCLLTCQQHISPSHMFHCSTTDSCCSVETCNHKVVRQSALRLTSLAVMPWNWFSGCLDASKWVQLHMSYMCSFNRRRFLGLNYRTSEWGRRDFIYWSARPFQSGSHVLAFIHANIYLFLGQCFIWPKLFHGPNQALTATVIGWQRKPAENALL